MKRIYIAAALVLSLFFTSCEREVDPNLDLGKSISFRSTTEYVNGSTTKTSYSGWIITGGKERIDWVSTDKIRIASPQASARYDSSLGSADYSVDVITTGSGADEYKSYATIKPDGGNGLVWGSDAQHSFYSIYPSPATSGMSDKISISVSESGGVSAGSSVFTIPSSQDYTYTEVTESGVTTKILKPNMNYAYMYASAQALPSSSAVTLSFKPMFTAFEFTIKRDDNPTGLPDNFTITSFEMSTTGASLTGSCTATLPSDSSSNDASFGSISDPSQGNNKKITVSFNGGTGYTITKDNPLVFTVFALPQTYGTSDDNGITVKFTTNYGKTKTLALKTNGGSWVQFDPCIKYRITGLAIPNNDWSYTLSDLEPLTLTYEGAPTTPAAWTDNFKSYRTHMGDNSVEEVVPYHLEYSTDNGASWSTTKPAWITPNSPTSPAFGGAGSSSADGENLTMTMTAQSRHDNADIHTDHLRAKSEITRDLSLFNGKGESVTGTTTANCYIVRDPGTYTFPLVYGNSLLNGSVNEAAFHRTVSASEITAALDGSSQAPLTVSAANFLDYYLDHNGDPITNDGGTTGGSYDKNSIYIAERFSTHTLAVKVLWEDADGIIDQSSGNAPTIVGSGTGAVLQFKVPKSKIQEGNALIAVTVDGAIAWSWQIWISDETLSSFPAKNGYSFATDNIGYVNGKKLFWPDRSCLVRAVQTGGLTSNQSINAVIKQEQNIDFDPLGNSTYYQWGRKDPLPGSNGNPDVPAKKTIFNVDSSFPSGAVNRQASSLTEAITHPNTHFAAHSGNDWCATSYLNLWNSSLTKPYTYGEISQIKNNIPTKTIYDPSPVGFMVPPVSAYEGYSASDFTFEEDLANLPDGYPQGYYMVGFGEDRFMPVTGYVDSGDIDGSDYIVHGIEDPELYYWASTPAAHVGDPVSDIVHAYEYVLRYKDDGAGTPKTVKFSSTYSFSKTSGISIRPVEERIPVTRIYVLEETGLFWNWGSNRVVWIELYGGAEGAATQSGTATFGSYTYTCFEVPTNLLGNTDWMDYDDGNGHEVAMGTPSLVLGRTYYFRTNGLEVVPVADPANPTASAYTKARVYVSEDIDTSLHNLWNSSFERKLYNSTNVVEEQATLETFGSYDYHYFEFDPLSDYTLPADFDYQSYENGSWRASVWGIVESSVPLQNGGVYFFRTNAHNSVAVTDPTSPETPYAIVYVLDETSTSSSVGSYWGSNRSIMVGSNEMSKYSTEDFTNSSTTKTYDFFIIPTDNSANTGSKTLVYKGENGLQVTLGTVNIAAGGEYFFRTNGYSAVQITSPTLAKLTTSLPALPVSTRIFVHEDTIISDISDHWDASYSRKVRPVGVSGTLANQVGTATIEGVSYRYFDVPYTFTTSPSDGSTGDAYLYYMSYNGNTKVAQSDRYNKAQGAPTGYIHWATGGDGTILWTNGIQLVDVSGNLANPSPTYTQSRVYFRETMDKTIHTEWSNDGRRLQVVYTSGYKHYYDFGDESFNGISYRYVDIRDLTPLSSSGNDLYLKCYSSGDVTNNGNIVQAKITAAQVKTVGVYFFDIDGKVGKLDSDGPGGNSPALPARLYLLEENTGTPGILSMWASGRQITYNGHNIDQCGSESIGGNVYNYFDIDASWFGSGSAQFRDGTGGAGTTDSYVTVWPNLSNGRELFYRTDGIHITSGVTSPASLPSIPVDSPKRAWMTGPAGSSEPNDGTHKLDWGRVRCYEWDGPTGNETVKNAAWPGLNVSSYDGGSYLKGYQWRYCEIVAGATGLIISDGWGSPWVMVWKSQDLPINSSNSFVYWIYPTPAGSASSDLAPTNLDNYNFKQLYF